MDSGEGNESGGSGGLHDYYYYIKLHILIYITPSKIEFKFNKVLLDLKNDVFILLAFKCYFTSVGFVGIYNDDDQTKLYNLLTGKYEQN